MLGYKNSRFNHLDILTFCEADKATNIERQSRRADINHTTDISSPGCENEKTKN